jgi:hypothetical protein
LSAIIEAPKPRKGVSRLSLPRRKKLKIGWLKDFRIGVL